MTSSTPDALWRSAALDVLHPSAIACAGVTRGRLLDRCNLTVPVGMRLLLVGQPDAAALKRDGRTEALGRSSGAS